MNRAVTWIKRYFQNFYPNRTATVRFTFSWLLFILAASGLAAVLQSNAETRVIIEVPSTKQLVGQSYTVNIYVFAKEPVNAVNLEINIPNSVVVQSIDKGESVITLWTKDPVVTDHVAYFEGGTYRKGFVGKHKIASLKVVSDSLDSAVFTIKKVSLLAGDGRGTELADKDVGLLTAEVKHTNDQNDTIITAVNTQFDITTDGKVSLADVSAFLAAWTKHSTVYDFNDDGVMNFRDFSILLTKLAY